MKRKYIIISVVALLAAGAVIWKFYGRGSNQAGYRTVPIEKGDMVQTVRATGVVEPVKLVQVGTQVNGPITKLYVDYNSLVKEGDLVAQIDPTVYQAQLARDQANLKSSMANVEQATARLAQAESELTRSRKLLERDMLSKADLEAAATDRDSLAAQLKVAEAAVEQSKAALSLSTANLGYTTIRSPVDGVVIARNVSEGQTVVASMSAQVLFMVATDLKQIQVEASIPEADIGKVRVGQTVKFTVDAYEQEFTGTVSQVRLSAATVQNVVTYPVIILADNPENKLYPSMTANISCEVAHRADVLKVPNAALRFKPKIDTSSDSSNTTEKAVAKDPAKQKERQARRAASAAAGFSSAKIWVLESAGGEPKPVRVRVGITDGAFTEVEAGDKLVEGQEVVVGLADSGAAGGQKTVNPFTPQMPNRGGPRR